jgi:hypothetical protein
MRAACTWKRCVASLGLHPRSEELTNALRLSSFGRVFEHGGDVCVVLVVVRENKPLSGHEHHQTAECRTS